MCIFENESLMMILISMKNTNKLTFTAMATHFQITHDETFLRQFRDKNSTLHHTDEEVALLRQASEQGDLYAKYAYGRWLYFANPHEGAIREAEELLFATIVEIPDSEAAYAMMIRYGETEVTHPPLMDIEAYLDHCSRALQRGSILGVIMDAKNRLSGQFCDAEPHQVVKEMETLLADAPDSAPAWHRILGYAYEELDRRDEAISQYEQAIAQGDLQSYSALAFLYYNRGNIALYEEIMEEGTEQGSVDCFFYKALCYEQEGFESLEESEQQHEHQIIDQRLRRGLALGDGFCGYLLWRNHYYGELGFEETDLVATLPFLRRGCELYDTWSMTQLADIMEDASQPIPNEMRLTATEIAELRLKVARHNPDDEEALVKLQSVSDPAFLLKYKQEFDDFWIPKFQQLADIPHPLIGFEDDEDELDDEELDDEDEVDEEDYEGDEELTPIDPSVILIWPSGHLEVVEADVSQMKSYREMAQELIRADGLDAVHFSPALTHVKEDAGLSMNVAMYVDRDANAKGLPDNAIGTILYGQGQEIRGPIIIALEDQRYDCYSFTTLDDLVDTYNAINDVCGGLLIIKDEDDGRYDPYA